MKKGLEFTELMQLKRETNPNQKDVFGGVEGDKKGNMTFINTGGLSIDFPQTENGMIYFAATEDCTIHRCSVSYSDNYYETYYGHTGPIYKIRCNPFWHSQECAIFMTCSYDWTVRIWKTKELSEKLVCHEMSNKEQVNDVQWSPHTSSVFASVTNDGRIEIWDLKKDNLNPLILHFDTQTDGVRVNTPKTVVAFGRESPVILTGNSKGEVDVYRVNGFEHVQVSYQDQISRLLQAIQKDDYTETKGKKKEGEGEGADDAGNDGA
jgi:WD40 repeat protein